MPHYTISEMSAQTGVPVPALRYYKRIGLLDLVQRAANRHRRYTEKAVLRGWVTRISPRLTRYWRLTKTASP